jgi:hypothetical protein
MKSAKFTCIRLDGAALAILHFVALRLRSQTTMQEVTAIAAYPLSMEHVRQTFAVSGDLYRAAGTDSKRKEENKLPSPLPLEEGIRRIATRRVAPRRRASSSPWRVPSTSRRGASGGRAR